MHSLKMHGRPLPGPGLELQGRWRSFHGALRGPLSAFMLGQRKAGTLGMPHQASPPG